MQRRRNRAAILWISYLTAAALCFGVLAGVEHERAVRWERSAVDGYQRAFGDLVTAVGEVDTALQKSRWAVSPSLTGAVCAEVFGKALTAQAALAALPFSPEELEHVGDFLSRVGDYAFCLSRSAMAGRELSEEERSGLAGLADAAEVLALNLREMRAGVQDGSLSLQALRRAGETLEESGDDGPAWAGDSLSLIEREFPELPSLIYDGPFSEHLTGRAPRSLEGLEEIDENAARRVAADFLNLSRARVYAAGEIAGDLPCWSMAADEEGGATLLCAVTKQGGRVLSMLSSRPVGSAVVDAGQAREAAARFLAAAGYSDMAETYYMTRGGVLTVNYAWQQDGVICYSDLVKVSVALDSGKVCGFEAKGYLTAHCVRELPEPAVDAETARAAVPPELEVEGVRSALVPSDGQYETLCHEFKCVGADGQRCLIYVNAQTGGQEKILLLLEDENGTLTI